MRKLKSSRKRHLDARSKRKPETHKERVRRIKRSNALFYKDHNAWIANRI